MVPILKHAQIQDGKAMAARSEDLTTLLARRVMGWDVAPDRFLVGNRKWMPRWQFQPAEKLEDAFRLLEAAAPQEYTMGCEGQELFWVRVRNGQANGHGTAAARHSNSTAPN